MSAIADMTLEHFHSLKWCESQKFPYTILQLHWLERLNLAQASFTAIQFFVYSQPVMAAQLSTSETESAERYCVFSLRKAVKMIQTEGKDIENTILLDDSDFSLPEEKVTEETASKIEPEVCSCF